MGVPTYLIADSNELDREWVEDARCVGVTAGASAPEELVEGVVNWLSRLGPVEVPLWKAAMKRFEFRLPAELARA